MFIEMTLGMQRSNYVPWPLSAIGMTRIHEIAVMRLGNGRYDDW
jgi:hypothetical protein